MGNLDSMTPTPQELADWEQVNPEDLGAPLELIQQYLQLSADLMVLATNITDAPDPNTPVGRLVKAGILDMTWYIGTTKESQNEVFSPFSGEHIGSYSYSKMAKAALRGDETGVNFFDLAVKYLKDAISYDPVVGIGGGSESVFWTPQNATRAQLAADKMMDSILRAKFGVPL